MLLGFLVIPLLDHELGSERLGVLTVIWAVVGYLSIFDLGIGRALTQRISRLNAQSDNKSICIISTSGTLLTLLLGILGACVVYSGVATFGVHWLNASDALAEELKDALTYSAFSIPLVTTTAALKGILEGKRAFFAVNVHKTILGILNFTSPIISVKVMGNNLVGIVFGLLISRMVVLGAHFWSTRGLFIRLTLLEFQTDCRCLMKFGLWMTISNIVSPLMVILDRFVISTLLGASLVAYYTVPADFLIRLLIVPAALTSALFPLFSADKSSQSDLLYSKAIKTVFFAMSGLMLGVCLAANSGLSVWLGDGYAANSTEVVWILSLGIIFNSVAQIPHAFIQSSGDAKTTGLLHVAEFLVYIPGLVVAIRNFGINGAALAWSTRAVLDFLLLAFFVKRINGAISESDAKIRDMHGSLLPK